MTYAVELSAAKEGSILPLLFAPATDESTIDLALRDNFEFSCGLYTGDKRFALLPEGRILWEAIEPVLFKLSEEYLLERRDLSFALLFLIDFMDDWCFIFFGIFY